MRDGVKPAGGLTRAGSLRDLEMRGRLRLQTGEADILVVMVDGEIFACSNACAHQHIHRLHEGALSGCALTCPMHGWTYDLRTGRSVAGDGAIPVYRVVVQGGEVMVDLG